ncbi:MAG: radical SAM protein [Deltaproteobacteria bacterium]|nr:radical SAM protein [Deltaproteobacteria bacterium]
MTIEVRPLGVHCNIGCQYCYQNPQRDVGHSTRPYDIDLMKKAILAEGGAFSIFGGEPLLVPLEDLENLWAWGLAQFRRNGIQTNGVLITDGHIRLFKSYRVQVGISIDGPGPLNDVRWNGTLSKTRKATALTEQAIERLCDEGIPPSLIITLHKDNATVDRLPVLIDWIRYLETRGVRSVRLHLLESENPEIRSLYGLTEDENTQVLLKLLEVERTLRCLRFDIFNDMRRMLMGQDDKVTCIWAGCDPYTTSAVRGVEGQGQRSNCGRTNKDGIDFVKAPCVGYERYLALFHTPQENGGCSGCRFFLMCKGNCPGTAIGGDWRNRTEHCEVWKGVYKVLERELIRTGKKPLSASLERTALERAHIESWARGKQVTMAAILGKQDSNKKDRNSPSSLLGDIQNELKRLRAACES